MTWQPPANQPGLQRWTVSPGPIPERRQVQPYPAPVYAHAVSNLPLSQTVPRTIHTFKTLNQVRQHRIVRDSDLAVLDDNMKKAGSLLIATLATLGLKQKVFGINEFLGFASWFAAMGITPKIINGMIRLKTGVNLGQQYQSTYGTRDDLFKDPNYLPLHVLSDAQINKAADRLGIPKNHPDRRKATEEKMRQIAVQGRTWWMLVAGPATPVISGLICDLLSDPVTRLFSSLKAAAHRNRAQAAMAQGGDKLVQTAERYVKDLVGELPESELSMWWKQFGRDMAERTGLKQALSVKDVVDSKREDLIDRLVGHFQKMNAQGTVPDGMLEYVESQKKHLASLEQKAHEFLAQCADKMDEAALKRQRQFVEIRINNAMSTLNHYETLANAIKQGNVDEKAIRKLLEKPVLAEVQRLIDTGFKSEARKLVGNDDIFREIQKALDGGVRQYGKAFKLMGASPAAHLATALNDTMLRKLWRTRILGYLGGGLLAASALYTVFFVGRDFGKKPGGAP